MIRCQIRTITPDEVFEMLCNLHPRYTDFWDDRVMKREGKLVAEGLKPIAYVNPDGVLYDGALALSGIFEHGEPSECVIICAPEAKQFAGRKEYPPALRKIEKDNWLLRKKNVNL